MSNALHEKGFQLGAWVEIVGKLIGISSDAHFTYLEIGNKVLSFPRESMQSEIIEKQLSQNSMAEK